MVELEYVPLLTCFTLTRAYQTTRTRYEFRIHDMIWYGHGDLVTNMFVRDNHTLNRIGWPQVDRYTNCSLFTNSAFIILVTLTYYIIFSLLTE
jgi:hypothetical protein